LLTKAFGYRLLRHASAILAQTEREERRTWSVNEYLSSKGNDLLNSNNIMDVSIANW
jgi:hypothetical protein